MKAAAIGITRRDRYYAQQRPVKPVFVDPPSIEPFDLLSSLGSFSRRVRVARCRVKNNTSLDIYSGVAEGEVAAAEGALVAKGKRRGGKGGGREVHL